MHEPSRGELPAAIVVIDGQARFPARVESTPADLGVTRSGFAEQFALARRDPAFARAMEEKAPRLPFGRSLRIGASSLGSGLLTASIFIETLGAFVLLAVAAALVSALYLATRGRRDLRRLVAPVVRHVVRVITRHARDSHDGGHRVLEGRATLELEDGSRIDVGGSDGVMNLVVEGDVGVAFVQHDRLTGFRRLTRA
jgi:hypothetical protein